MSLRNRTKYALCMLLAVMCVRETGGAATGGNILYYTKNKATNPGFGLTLLSYAGFFDATSWGNLFNNNFIDSAGEKSGFAYRLTSYFDFDTQTQILKVGNDEITLTKAQINQLLCILEMVYSLEGEALYKSTYMGLNSAPLILSSTDKTKTYIIDLQWKDKNSGNYINNGYYFLLGISDNGDIDPGIQSQVSGIQYTNTQGIKDLLKKIPFKNPYVYQPYYAYESGDGLMLRVRTGGQAQLGEYVNVPLSANDIRGIFKLIKEYNDADKKSATYTKSDYHYYDCPYRITFHFDGKGIYFLPVYSENKQTPQTPPINAYIAKTL